MSGTPEHLELHAIPGMPLVAAGDDIADLICTALADANLRLVDDDVLVVAQKIVSKAEGRLVKLSDVTPSARANTLAAETSKDARIVELILRESVAILRQRQGLIIAETRHGIVMANAGIDQSNIEADSALLLPEDPDHSAEVLRRRLESRLGVSIGIIIADSIGRAWRKGVLGHAIGAAGIQSIMDLRGKRDLLDRELRVTEVAIADAMAAAATLLMGQADEGRPVVRMRGFAGLGRHSNASAIIRPIDEDMFR